MFLTIDSKDITFNNKTWFDIPKESLDISKENISQVKPKKVVQCEGCGAFVIVPIGEVICCDYCDRPTT